MAITLVRAMGIDLPLVVGQVFYQGGVGPGTITINSIASEEPEYGGPDLNALANVTVNGGTLEGYITADPTATYSILYATKAPDTYKNLFLIGPTPTTLHIEGGVTKSTGGNLSGVLVTNGTQSATTDGSGIYDVLSIPAPFTGTLTPSKAGWTFAPLNVSYSGIYFQRINVNFVATISTPPKVTNPDPPDFSDISYNTRNLYCDTASGATSYDIYFGTDGADVSNATHASPEFKGNQANTTYQTSAHLDTDVTYYWRVDSVNGSGTTKGDVWSFTTITPTPTYNKIQENCLFDDSGGGFDAIGEDVQEFQSFVPTNSHSMPGVSFTLGRIPQTLPGTITVRLYLASTTVPPNDPTQAKPTGSILASSTFDGNELSTWNTGNKPNDEIYFQFNSPASVTAGTMYVLTVKADDSGAALNIKLSTSNLYASGSSAQSYDSGSTWSINAGSYDLWFKEYSVLAKPTDPTPSSPGTGIDNMIARPKSKLTFKNGGGAEGYFLYHNFGGGALQYIATYIATGFSVGDLETIVINWPISSLSRLNNGGTYKWRVDPYAGLDTVIGDEWTFTVADRFYAKPSSGGGTWPDPVPDGEDPTINPGDSTGLGTNSMLVTKRLAACAKNTFYYESL